MGAAGEIRQPLFMSVAEPPCPPLTAAQGDDYVCSVQFDRQTIGLVIHRHRLPRARGAKGRRAACLQQGWLGIGGKSVPDPPLHGLAVTIRQVIWKGRDVFGRSIVPKIRRCGRRRCRRHARVGFIVFGHGVTALYARRQQQRRQGAQNDEAGHGATICLCSPPVYLGQGRRGTPLELRRLRLAAFASTGAW